MKHFIVLFSVLFLTSIGFAEEAKKQNQKEAEKSKDGSDDRPLSPSAWQEVHGILDEIRRQNIERSIRLVGKFGFIQMKQNTNDAVDLGGALAGVGLDASVDIYKNFSFEVSYLQGQNIAPIPDSPNGTSASIYWLYAGPKYTFYFDSTQIDDYFALKLMYHINSNNFEIKEPSSLIFVNKYTAFAPGFERSIPLTRKLGILASFYLLQITEADTKSSIAIKKQGYGFQVSGELYYQTDIFNFPLRIGANYMQSGYENEFEESDYKTKESKNSYFQLAQSAFLNFTALF